MKKPIINLMRKSNYDFLIPRISLLMLVITFILFGFQTKAQGELPVVKIRLVNPSFDCKTRLYCLDVEFQTDTEDQQLFGLNLRLFYDDDVLEFHSMTNFEEGYESIGTPQLVTGPDGSGDAFGLSGPIEWLNGLVQKTDFSPIFLSTVDTVWTPLFSICFHVDDVSQLLPNFCPPIIFDLQEDANLGGYFYGDDGVVISLSTADPSISLPTTEYVVQYNWVYEAGPESYGTPEPITCIVPDQCVPVSNWAIYLAIGLMMVVVILVYRKRIAG